MHNACEIIRDIECVDGARLVLFKVFTKTRMNVLSQYPYVMVTIWPVLFVIESYSVADFMDDDSFVSTASCEQKYV